MNVALYDFTIIYAIFIGTIGLSLLAVYPIQLSYHGQDYWQCIQNRYTMQAPGMVAFIYIPTSLAFNLILFAASLYERKIITCCNFKDLSDFYKLKSCTPGKLLRKNKRKTAQVFMLIFESFCNFAARCLKNRQQPKPEV